MIVLLLAGCRDAQVFYDKVKQAAVAAEEKATTPPMPCDARVDDDPPVNCLSGELVCGQTIEGTIEGGQAEWNDDFYAGKFCFPAGDDRSGPERVYLLRAPAEQDITIKLQSDCVDLDLVALAWHYDGTCPGVNHLVPECEGDAKRGGGTVRLNTFKARDYLVAVEGKHKETGPFRLTVQCSPLGGRL